MLSARRQVRGHCEGNLGSLRQSDAARHGAALAGPGQSARLLAWCEITARPPLTESRLTWAGSSDSTFRERFGTPPFASAARLSVRSAFPSNSAAASSRAAFSRPSLSVFAGLHARRAWLHNSPTCPSKDSLEIFSSTQKQRTAGARRCELLQVTGHFPATTHFSLRPAGLQRPSGAARWPRRAWREMPKAADSTGTNRLGSR